MLETLNNINLGKDTRNDFKESKSSTIIKWFMEKNNKIKVRTNEADKIPNLDGKIMILDSNSMERITVEVQIKTLPFNYDESIPYKYSCDTKVFNVVLHNVTFNPVVLLLVDENNEKLFWKYISKDYAKSLNIGFQKTKMIEFNENDLYDESKFLNQMEDIFKKIGIFIENGSNPYLLIEQNNPHLLELQKEVDRLNEMFDNGLKPVKDLLFPKVWKFGIAYDEYDNGVSAFGIYQILKGKNDILIRNFDIKSDNYMRINFTGPASIKSISKNINELIEDILNVYFNVHGLHPKYLPDMVLNEIVFEFLDRLARDIKELQKDDNNNYINDIESLDNVLKYYNGLKTYHYRLVKEYPNSQLTKALLNIYKSYDNRFLLFNPLLQPSKEEYITLVDSINNPSELPCEIRFIGSDIDIDLFELTLEELKSRKIKQVSRVWNTHKWKLYKKEHENNTQLKTVAHGFTINDLYTNLDILFNNITNIYNQSYIKYFGSDDKYKIHGEIIITYSKERPYHYDLFYHSSNNFNIKVEHIDREIAIKKYGDFSYFETSSSGHIDSAFAIKLPLYNYIRLLINLGISLSYGLSFKYNSEVNKTYTINELPLISDYILMCEDKNKS